MRRDLLSLHNPLLSAARAAVRPTPVLLALFVALIVSYLTASAQYSASNLLFPDYPSPAQEPTQATVALMVELLVGFGGMILFVWLWLRFFEHRPFASLGLWLRGAPRLALRGALVGLLVMVAIVLSLSALSFVEVEHGSPGQVGVGALGGVLFATLGYAVQGSAEEIFYRGWILQTTAVRWGPVAGFFVSCLFFPVDHFVNNPDLGPLAFLNLFLLGAFFALYALRDGSLWGACALHAAYNWAETNLFGFDFYGEEAPGGTLLNLREAGPDFATGGEMGVTLTGGLVQTVVVVVGIVVLLLVANRRPRTVVRTPRAAHSKK
jgi:uncharacterized protein